MNLVTEFNFLKILIASHPTLLSGCVMRRCRSVEIVQIVEDSGATF